MVRMKRHVVAVLVHSHTLFPVEHGKLRSDESRAGMGYLCSVFAANKGATIWCAQRSLAHDTSWASYA